MHFISRGTRAQSTRGRMQKSRSAGLVCYNWPIVVECSEETSIIHRCFECFVAKIVLTQQEWLKPEAALSCQKEEHFQWLDL